MIKRKLISLLGNPFLNENIQRLVRPIGGHRREISKIVEKESYRTALDFGCGEGLFCRVFDREKYLGYDRDRRRVDYATRKYPGYSFSSEEIESFRNIDMFVFNNVLHHMSEEEIRKIFKKIAEECGIRTRIIILEVYPAPRQVSKITKMLMKIEERTQGSSWKEADGWLRCVGENEFSAETIEDIGRFFIIEIRLEAVSKPLP